MLAAGIEIDTVTRELRLPLVKLTWLKNLLAEWLLKKACTREALESLLISYLLKPNINTRTSSTLIERPGQISGGGTHLSNRGMAYPS